MAADLGETPRPTTGVTYVCGGEHYIRAAIASAHTVRKWCPGLPIHLFADWPRHGFEFDRDPRPFSSVTAIEATDRFPKVDYLPQSPYDWTLYLDTDTSVRSDIRQMFRLMERFDLAMAHAHHRHGQPRPTGSITGLPDAFPEFNTGVVLYRKSTAVLQLFAEWQAEYHSEFKKPRNDQVPMRHCVWASDVRIATLPPEYNVRFIKYHLLWSKREAESQIFHLRLYHVGWYAWLFRPLAKFQTRVIRRLRKYGKGGLWRGRGDS